MDWPPQSPNLKVINAVWDHFDREWNKRQHVQGIQRRSECPLRSLKKYF